MPTKNYTRPLTVTEMLNFKEIPDWIEQIAETFIAQGYQIFLVGGAVRDMLLGLIPEDWDLTTDATPDRIEALFPVTYPSGKAYGTITIIKDGHLVEITTLREDLGYSDGRHPEKIQFTDDILKDLGRRDFTVNAIAYSFTERILIDPFNGIADLSRQLLRTVGDPQTRFREDGLRMFRFFRFLATASFNADRKTLIAISPEFARQLSPERIRDELSKLLLGKWVRRGLEGLEKSGLLQTAIPELEIRSFKEGFARYNLWEHLLRTTETIQPSLVLRWAALLHDIAKPLTYRQTGPEIHFYGHDETGAMMARSILTRLRYPNALINNVEHLIHHHMFHIPFNASDAAIRRFIIKAGPDNIHALLELRRSDIVATDRITPETFPAWSSLSKRVQDLMRGNAPLTPKEMAVNGHDLIQTFRLNPGPEIGQLLDYLFDLVIEEPKMNQKELLLQMAEKYLQRH